MDFVVRPMNRWLASSPSMLVIDACASCMTSGLMIRDAIFSSEILLQGKFCEQVDRNVAEICCILYT